VRAYSAILQSSPFSKPLPKANFRDTGRHKKNSDFDDDPVNGATGLTDQRSDDPTK
jgi:hypothetical protein